MSLPSIELFKQRFFDYSKRYQDIIDSDKFGALTHKIRHTERVLAVAEHIAQSIKLDGDLYLGAQSSALFHDCGRFEQYKQFKTFADRQSVDHGDLGVKIIREENFLAGLPDKLAESVIFAVSVHNKRMIPESDDKDGILFAQITRDADKLDILDFLSDYYVKRKAGLINPVYELFMEDKPEISESLCRSLLAGECGKYSDAKTLNDFKLTQIGLFYDINFPASFKITLEKKHLDMLLDSLPHEQFPVIKEIYGKVLNHAKSRAIL